MEELILTALKEYGATIFILGVGCFGMYKLLERCERREELSREKWEAAQNRTVDMMTGVIEKNTEAYLDFKQTARELRK